MNQTPQNNEERAVLVGTVFHGFSRWESEDFLDELELLAQTAGAQVVERILQKRKKADPAFFIGRGKAESIAILAKQIDANLVIFDDDLSPAQVRNLEKTINTKIIDRTGLILDIFAHRAKTKEAKTQVELAQLNYLLPRLTRQWKHLSRQIGGIGVRGPGETQLEVDRRLIRKRMRRLNDDLKKIENQRRTQRSTRKDVFKIALVGYTNVGKSTLLNALSGADVFVEDLLFATLDSTVRAVELSNDHKVLFTDTVGFIRKLPTHLVASFKSTLEETKDSDLLLHVVDLSHPKYEEQIDTVCRILTDLNLNIIPSLFVFNKVDQVKKRGLLRSIKAKFPDSVLISAMRLINLDDLKHTILKIIEENFVERSISLTPQHAKLISQIHQIAKVVNTKYNDQTVDITYRSSLENAIKIDKLVRNKSS